MQALIDAFTMGILWLTSRSSCGRTRSQTAVINLDSSGEKKRIGGMCSTLVDNNSSRGLVPECLLAQSMEAGVVARLAFRFKWLAGAGSIGRDSDSCESVVAVDQFWVGVELGIYRSLRNMLARRPRNPQAANSSGAKIGGPYITL